jgi:2-phospho-L-lactate guanylyltransferase
MTAGRNIWAVVPVKETAAAKQRLAGVLPARARQQLALAMLEDVLQALARVPELGGMVVVTVDAAAAEIAARAGAQVWSDGARDGHTGAVTAAARRLAGAGAGMLTIPGDVPLVAPADIRHLLQAHRASPGFTIVPAHDRCGSNAIVCTPPDLVPLRFGRDSFVPHLAAARRCGVEPAIVHLARLALDIDEPADLLAFTRVASGTRARALLERLQLATAEAVPADGAAAP